MKQAEKDLIIKMVAMGKSPEDIGKRFGWTEAEAKERIETLRSEIQDEQDMINAKKLEAIDQTDFAWLELCKGYQMLGEQLKEMGERLCNRANEFELSDDLEPIIGRGRAERVAEIIHGKYILIGKEPHEHKGCSCDYHNN